MTPQKYYKIFFIYWKSFENKTKSSVIEVSEMRRFEREVVDYKLIEAMLQEMNIINVGMNDEDVRL